MLLALDVFYSADIVKAVGVLFEWKDVKPQKFLIEYLDKVEEYVPGEFYKRELPCLLKIIEKIDISEIEVIIIDGYVYVDNEMKLGLGGILWEELDRKIPVIGVAKTSFLGNKDTTKEIIRRESKKPLYISSIGYPVDEALEKVKSMHGEYRIPAI